MPPADSFLETLDALHEGSTYLRLLNAMPVMLWTADATGVWQHVNSRWADYSGLTGHAAGFGFEEAMHPADIPRALDAWRQSISSKDTYRIEYRLRSQGGSYRWFLIEGVCVTDRAGQGIAWVGTCTDIEAQKQAEREALDTREAGLRALGLALEARDRETRGHTDRVTAQALQLGQLMGLSPAQLHDLRLGAYLHDLGKIAVPDHILLKPGPLTPAERREMQGHAGEGERLAAALGFVPPAALELVRHHHERWDGQGYPDGLAGEYIPLLARIFAVIDVYDALTSDRPYKQAWPHERARAELQAEAGKHFDPAAVRAFLELELRA